MRIALDAMGGDHGFKELVAGAVLAARQSELQVVLVGDEQYLRPYLQQVTSDSSLLSRIEIVHASQAVGMDESPVDAIRRKKDSSIMVAFDLAFRGEVEAVVSAGNSGATMAAAVRKLGRIKHVSRPGIAGILPTQKKPVVVMDVGANVDCRPQHLVQFAIMASNFSRILDTSNPRVGILSIGEETGKGNILVKETHTRLAKSSLNFIGNVEGRDIFEGDVDVVVCDGFVGNICLKIGEGLSESILQMLKEAINKSLIAKIGFLFARPALQSFKKRFDYAEYGGAPLLGINGTGIICHGKSNAEAIKNAIFQAAEMVKLRVNDRIAESLAANALIVEPEA
ncbi:MAG: phosphate acyltransferase PlsX [Desulfobulbaceae bacterium]|uniref:Phosphate acyltransferase n=1 Tax=Candidatus Desulfatifera sulfidica TaxID=2841691 RepID=A0A8J6N5P8_9BACT|nr:phosphate acyltransferase PlsX [Candidatus Desulfatifera sulfidica]